jgi:phenylacetate-CoA ligase
MKDRGGRFSQIIKIWCEISRSKDNLFFGGDMEHVRYIWSSDYVGERLGLQIPEEGDRGKPFSEKHWSQVDVLPLSRLKEIQMEKLKHLLRFAWDNSPFYRRRWEEHGVKPEDVQTLDDFTRFPIMTKKDFIQDQIDHPPFGTVYTRLPNTQAKYWQTSGSTGKPTIWSDTKEDLENEIFRLCRFLYANGIRPGWRIFFAFPFPPFNGFWNLHHATEAFGCQNVPKGSLATTGWLTLMQRLAGTASSAVATTPTFAIRQQEVAKEMALDLRGLKIDRLLLAGEPGATVPATKKLLEDAWGAKATDFFGSTENGTIAFTCSEQVDMEQPSDHIFNDYHIFELLDRETMKPVEPGNPGALCITSLVKFGMPCIRYFLGDYIHIDEETKCPCGRTLLLIRGGVQARADDMIIVKGENIYPSLLEECVRSTSGLSPEYRIQKTTTSATVYVEASPNVSPDGYQSLAEKLQHLIKDKLYVTLDIEILEPGKLPRETAKTRRLITDKDKL